MSIRWSGRHREIAGPASSGNHNDAMSNAAQQTPESAERRPVSRRRIAVNFLTVAGANVFGLVVTIVIGVHVRLAQSQFCFGPRHSPCGVA